MTRLILFDFDGTIANTLKKGLQIYNLNAEDQGFRKILNLDEVKKLTIPEFLRQFRIPVYKVPFLMRKFHAIMNKDIDRVPLFKGMKHVLSSLSKRYPLGILSSNTEKNIEKFLNAKKIRTYFEFIIGYPAMFGKASAIKRICKIRAIPHEEVIYIGDEVRDIHATKKIGVKMIAVTWGYNAKERLKKEDPEWIIDTPEEILPIIH